MMGTGFDFAFSAAPTLLGRVPNAEAIAMAPTIGWLVLMCAAALLALVILQRESWRRFWLRTEDPRAIGLFRIVFAFLVLCNINGLWEHFEFLFTDEGLFVTETARQVVAGSQFAGYGDGYGADPRGFFDAQAWLTFLRGPKYSLLFFWDSPQFFWAHLWAFEIATLLFLIGWRSRWTGLLSFVLMMSLANRNPIYWTGADVVYRTLFLFVVMSRSGHAYSLDNWLRCRRLRKQGLLDEVSGARRGAGKAPDEEHPRGLQAIYRRIPAWPRVFMMMQVATVYFTTGCLKTGSVWWRGDSLYYALQLDHFSRFPTQVVADLFGTNLFRLSTWVVHFWQIGFPLLLVGLVLRWAVRERVPRPSGLRLWAIRGCWLVIGLGAMAITLIALPVHYPHHPALPDIVTVQWLTAGGWLAGMALIGWGYHRLRYRPFELEVRGRRLTLDLDTFCRWFLGRRLWLALGVIFHMQILVLMNIGMFAPIMIGAYFVFLNGNEVSVLLRRIAGGLARLRVPGVTRLLDQPRAVTEDPRLPHLHHDETLLPAWAMWTGLGLGLSYVVMRVYETPGARWIAAAGLLVVFGAGIVGVVRSRGASVGPTRRAWAYGPLGRLLIGGFVVTHIAAVAVWLMPSKDCTSTWRKTPRQIAGTWLAPLQAQQSWSMFAPNPLRRNVFMLIHLTDGDGNVWDMYTDANSPRNKEMPWIWYDRAGKITRRVTGKGKSYQKWVLRYHCRKWAMEHGGELPTKVEMYKTWYDVPPPGTTDPYRPADRLAEHGRTQHVLTAQCHSAVDAQPDNEVRARHGLPEVDEDSLRRWHKNRKRRWDAKREAETAQENDQDS